MSEDEDRATQQRAPGASGETAAVASRPRITVFWVVWVHTRVTRHPGKAKGKARRAGKATARQDAVSAQKVGRLQPFVADVFPQECVGQLASLGPT